MRNGESTDNGSDPQLILRGVNPLASVKRCPFTAAKDLILCGVVCNKSCSESVL